MGGGVSPQGPKTQELGRKEPWRHCWTLAPFSALTGWRPWEHFKEVWEHNLDWEAPSQRWGWGHKRKGSGQRLRILSKMVPFHGLAREVTWVSPIGRQVFWGEGPLIHSFCSPRATGRPCCMLELAPTGHSHSTWPCTQDGGWLWFLLQEAWMPALSRKAQPDHLFPVTRGVLRTCCGVLTSSPELPFLLRASSSAWTLHSQATFVLGEAS